MGKRVSHIIKPICFLAIFLLIFSWISEVFREENNAGIRSFYMEEKDSLDVVFIGPSTTYTSVYPLELWEQYGIASYAFTSPSQTFADSYYALQEVVSQQSPELVLIDVFLGAKNSDINRSYQHLFTDTLRFSQIKIDCIENTIDEGKAEFYLPFLSYHTRWSSLTKSDFLPKLNYGKGCYPNYTVTKITPNEWAAGDETEAPNDTTLEYLNKMIEFCKENDVNVLFTAPANNTSDVSYQKTVNGMAQIIEENGYQLLNLRNYSDEIGLDVSTDFRDEHHPNHYGGSKISKFLGEYIKENYDIPDRRNDPGYDSWNDDYEKYVIWNNTYKLNKTTNFIDYLSSIDLDSYTVVMAVRDDAQKAFGAEQAEAFKALGLSPFSEEDFRSGYIAVLNSGEVVYQAKNAAQQLEADLTIDGVHYVISSAGLTAGDSVSIKVNGTECAVGKRGINIVVYDNWSGNVVDKVCFDTHVEETTCRR